MQVNTLEAEGPILDYLVSVVLGYDEARKSHPGWRS